PRSGWLGADLGAVHRWARRLPRSDALLVLEREFLLVLHAPRASALPAESSRALHGLAHFHALSDSLAPTAQHQLHRGAAHRHERRHVGLPWGATLRNTNAH